MDLDNTMIYSSSLPGSEGYRFYAYQRPGLCPFLQELALMGEMFLFTNEKEHYAAPLVDGIERISGIRFRKRFYRQDCAIEDGKLIKRLESNVLQDYQLEDIVIIDDSPLVKSTYPLNTLQVKKWVGNIHDRDLDRSL